MHCPRCNTHMIETNELDREEFGTLGIELVTVISQRECPTCGITIRATIPPISSHAIVKVHK